MRPLSLFYCYAKKDEEYRWELERHLKLLRDKGLIEPDGMVLAGDNSNDRIVDGINKADIILVLISVNFFNEYKNINIERALSRHQDEQARLIPILVGYVHHELHAVASLAHLPENGVPISAYPDRDQAWADVSRKISEVVAALHAARPAEKPAAPANTTPRIIPKKTTPARILAEADNEVAKKLFSEIMQLAKASGHYLYYGYKGFSERAPGRQKGVPFLYGYPPHRIELYFAAFPPERFEDFREEIRSKFPVFNTAGQFTLRLDVTEEADALQVLEARSEILAELSRGAGESS